MNECRIPSAHRSQWKWPARNSPCFVLCPATLSNTARRIHRTRNTGTHALWRFHFRWLRSAADWPLSFALCCMQLCEPPAALRSSSMMSSKWCDTSWNRMPWLRCDSMIWLYNWLHSNMRRVHPSHILHPDCLAKSMASIVRNHLRLDACSAPILFCTNHSRFLLENKQILSKIKSNNFQFGIRSERHLLGCGQKLPLFGKYLQHSVDALQSKKSSSHEDGGRAMYV